MRRRAGSSSMASGRRAWNACPAQRALRFWSCSDRNGCTLLRDGETQGDNNVFDMVVDEVVHYGDAILAVGKTHRVPLRARIVGDNPELVDRGSTIRLAWAATDAHVLVG